MVFREGGSLLLGLDTPNGPQSGGRGWAGGGDRQLWPLGWELGKGESGGDAQSGPGESTNSFPLLFVWYEPV